MSLPFRLDGIDLPGSISTQKSMLIGEPATKSTPGGFRLLVTGGRQFAGKNFTFRALDILHTQMRLGMIIEGGAVDAYSLSNEWAHRNDVPMETVPLQVCTKLQGKRAGYERNAYMLATYKPHAVLFFPGGRGTLNMESLATAAGIPVISATRLLADPPTVIAALKLACANEDMSAPKA